MVMSGSPSMEHFHALQAFASPIPKGEQNASFSNMLQLTGPEDNDLPMNQEPLRWASLEQSCVGQEEQQVCDQEDQQHEAFREPAIESELEDATPMDQASANLYLADEGYTPDNENYVDGVTGNNPYISSFADNVLENLSGQDEVNAPVDQFPANEHQNTEIAINVSATSMHESNAQDMVVNLSANVDLGENKGVSISAYVNECNCTAPDLVVRNDGGCHQFVTNGIVSGYGRDYGRVDDVLVDKAEIGNGFKKPHDMNEVGVENETVGSCDEYVHAKMDADGGRPSIVDELSDACRGKNYDADNVCAVIPHDMGDGDFNGH